MLPTTDEGSYTSSNHHKYAKGGPVYHWLLSLLHDDIHTFVQRFSPRTVLDAGCGEGFLTADLKRRDPSLQLHGVDLSDGAIDYARRHHGHAGHFETGCVYDLPYDDDAFDVVLCSEVLEHLDEPDRATSELKRVARHGVVITVPNEPYFEITNRVGRVLGLSPDPGHVQFWTRTSFPHFLKRHFLGATVATQHVFLVGAGIP